MAVAQDSPLVKLELVRAMSKDSQLEPQAFVSTVMRMCFDVQITKEQFLAFLLVANEYGLNPLTKEIHGFAKGGKVGPIVGIDGWLSMINKRRELDGIEYEDHVGEKGEIEAITCIIYRNDRTHPVKVTEYLSECRMDTSTWKKWPIRMLRHKATIQCARVAFGFSGIYDPDEAQRIRENDTIPGSAEIVPDDAPADPAARITQKIGGKVSEMGFAPSEELPEASGGDIDGSATVVEEEPAAEPAADDPGLNAEADPKLDEIPGLKKGSEVKKPGGKKKPQEQSNEEFVRDLMGGENE